MAINFITPMTPVQPIESQKPVQGGTQAGSLPFADMLSQAMQEAGSAQQAAEQDALDLVLGTGDDLHSIMIRSVMETTAIETAVELTARVVGAYKEIMQMQV